MFKWWLLVTFFVNLHNRFGVVVNHVPDCDANLHNIARSHKRKRTLLRVKNCKQTATH